MNVEALKKTRKLLASEKGKKYDQTTWRHACGSPACVAGFACVANGISLEGKDFQEIAPLAQSVLELSSEERWEMFEAIPDSYEKSRAAKKKGDPFCLGNEAFPARKEALAMLDHAIKTGKVKWRCLR